MMQVLWPWGKHSVCTLLYGIWCLGILFIFYQYWLPNLWSNLGIIKRNQALMETTLTMNGLADEDLSQAINLLAHSGRFDACNSLGFLPQSVIACAEVAQWTKTAITLTDNTKHLAYLAPPAFGAIKYGQSLSLILPVQEFSNIDEITLMTYTGHSTRIQQGKLVAYAVIITKEKEAYLIPLRAGFETAEGSYDFPDVSPKHAKPTIIYPRPGGEAAYPTQLRFAHPVSLTTITFVFTYAEHWHIEPVLIIWAISAESVSSSVSHSYLETKSDLLIE